MGGCLNLFVWSSQEVFGVNVSVVSIIERVIWFVGKGEFKIELVVYVGKGSELVSQFRCFYCRGFIK